MPAISCLLVLSSVLFVLTIISIGVGMLIVSEDTLANTALEIGKGESMSAWESVSLQIENHKRTIQAISSEVRLKSPHQSYEGVTHLFNETLHPRWLADVSQPRQPDLGYGLCSFFNITTDAAIRADPANMDPTTVNFAYPVTSYDLQRNNQRQILFGNQRNNQPSQFYALNFTTNPTTNEIETKETFVYDHVRNLTSFYERVAFAYNPPGENDYWHKPLLWVADDGNLYHYLTYWHSFQLKESLYATHGWLPTSQLLGTLNGGARQGLLVLVDGETHVLGTSDDAINRQFEDAVQRREFNNSVRELRGDEIASIPNEYIRNVLRSIQGRLVFPPQEEPHLDLTNSVMNAAFRQDVDGEGSNFIVIREVRNSRGLQLALVWMNPTEALVAPMRRTQLTIGLTLCLFAILVAVLLPVISFLSVVRPLSVLSRSMTSLSELKMEEVQDMDQEIEMQQSSITEVRALYKSYRWLRRTVEDCLPFIPRESISDGKAGEDLEDELESIESSAPASLQASFRPLNALSDDEKLFHSVNFGEGSLKARSVRSQPMTVEEFDASSNSGSGHRPDLFPLSPVKKGTAVAPHTQSRVSVVAEMAAKELQHYEATVLRVELTPELSYAVMDRAFWREVLLLLHHEGSIVAQEKKGTVFHLSPTGISLVWSKMPQQARKAAEAVHTLFARIRPKLVQLIPEQWMDQPLIGCGIADGSAIIGVCGSHVKKSFVCDGPPVSYSRLLARMALCDHAGVYCSARVAMDVAMFAECRPVDFVEVPSSVSALGVTPSRSLIVYQCCRMRAEGDDEWMYLLQKQETTGNRDSCGSALEKLLQGKLDEYRKLLSGFTPVVSDAGKSDSWLVQRKKAFYVAEDQSSTTLPTVVPPVVEGYFRSISQGSGKYARSGTIINVGPLDLVALATSADKARTAGSSERPRGSTVFPGPVTPPPLNPFVAPSQNLASMSVAEHSTTLSEPQQ